MSKERVIFPKQEDRRLRSRVLKKLRSLLSAGNPTAAAADGLPNRWKASGLALISGTVFGYCLLANFIPDAWLTVTQTALISAIAGFLAALWTFIYITNAKRLLKRGFVAGAFMTLLAIIGYSLSFKFGGVEVAAGTTPMQGWSIIGAIIVVILLFLAMLDESKNS